MKIGPRSKLYWRLLGIAAAAMYIALGLLVAIDLAPHGAPTAALAAPSVDKPTHTSYARSLDVTAPKYIVLTWNDLGMHCYNRDFRYVAVLPPANTLFAQVLRIGNPPQVITTGITVSYFFADNTYSVGKSNFWTYAPQLFPTVPMSPNIGLFGKGLAGVMDLSGNHFEAPGIPLTEFRDSAPTTPYPYQLATVVVQDAASHAELARTIVVAPVSTEMHCDNCHHDGGVEGIATGIVEKNILTLHDREENTHLVSEAPVLCARCHASNALGPLGAGQPGIPNFSRAMHDKHQEAVPSTLDGCYNCHPGPQTRCLRDVMSQRGMTCSDCHGDMTTLANPTRNPWLTEPRCDTCHRVNYQQDDPLYRHSKGHAGIYCATCHDSPHAIALSREPNDAIKFISWQGHSGTLSTCTACHGSTQLGPGPHGILAPTLYSLAFQPDHAFLAGQGAQGVYTHTLRNTGNLSDTYTLAWTSSQGWASLAASAAGLPVSPADPIALLSGQEALLTVTVTVPGAGAAGLVDTTRITATSVSSPTVAGHVTDVTRVKAADFYLPVLWRQNGL